jgi:putative redox protein
MTSARATKTDVGLLQVNVDTGSHSFLVDEPVDVGGLDSGPNPFDLLCAAIASCTLMTLRLYATRKGWILDDLKVQATYQAGSASKRARFDRIIDPGNATEEQREALLNIAQRCPVHLLLERGADLTVVVSEAELPQPVADRAHAREMELSCLEF